MRVYSMLVSAHRPSIRAYVLGAISSIHAQYLQAILFFVRVYSMQEMRTICAQCQVSGVCFRRLYLPRPQYPRCIFLAHFHSFSSIDILSLLPRLEKESLLSFGAYPRSISSSPTLPGISSTMVPGICSSYLKNPYRSYGRILVGISSSH